MNGLLHRFHNFVLPFVRGEDGVCACTCGTNHDYHVLPYHEARATVNSGDDHYARDVMTKQEADVVIGLLMGLCVSQILIWLRRVNWRPWFRSWRLNQLQDLGFRSWIPRFGNFRESFRRTRGTNTEDLQTEWTDAALPDLNGHGTNNR